MRNNELNSYGKRFAELYDTIRGYRDPVGEVDRLYEVFGQRLAKGAAILDLGCGTGLHAIELAKRGYKVTGIDLSPDMIDVAKRKGCDATFLCGNIEEQRNLGKFDGCVSLGNVINCLDGLDSLRAFFGVVPAVLNPKARFICECWNPIAIIQTPPTRVVREYDCELGRVTRTALPEWDFMKQELFINYEIEVRPPKDPAAGSKYVIVHQLLLFTPLEIEYCLKHAGFDQVEVRTGLPEFQVAGPDDRMLAVSCVKA